MDQLQISYCLLAHIYNDNRGIKDLSEVLLPLVRRGIASLSQTGMNKENSQEILHQTLLEMFGLDFPYSLQRKLLEKIAKEENDRQEGSFVLFQDGSYIIKDYLFEDFANIIADQEAELIYLKEEFEKYLDYIEVPIADRKDSSIFEFLQKDSLSLSSFFEGTTTGESRDYYYEAEFVKECRKSKLLTKIIKKYFIGSIISSYLIGGNIQGIYEGIEIILDTNVLVSILDLNSVESNHTCIKILEIGKRLGFSFKTFDFHLEETQNLLNRSANELTSSSSRVAYPGTVEAACIRRELSPTDLTRIADQLRTILIRDHHISILKNDNGFSRSNHYSEDFKRLKEIRRNTLSAKNDATVLDYVRQKRTKYFKEFHEVPCWLLSASNFDLSFLFNGEFLPEIIKTDDLLNILWLSNPTVNSNLLETVGLSRLIASSIDHHLQYDVTVQEFSKNVTKYASDSISPRDCFTLATRVSRKSIVNLHNLNELAEKNKQEFITEVQRIAQEVASTPAFPINEISDEEGIATARSRIKISSINVTPDPKAGLIKEIKALEKHLNSLRMSKSASDKQKELYIERIKITITVFSILLIGLIGTVIYFVKWDKIEPLTFIIPVIIACAALIYFVWLDKNFTIKGIYKEYISQAEGRADKKMGFDRSEYDRLIALIASLEEKLTQLQ